MDDVNCAKLAAVEMMDIFSERHQVYYGVHEDTKYVHIHFAVNAVSFLDGKKWHKSRKELGELEEQVRETMEAVLGC